MRYFLITSFLLITLRGWGQAGFKLSYKHQIKLTSVSSGHKRIVKFHKYLKRDSTRYSRLQEKKYKKVVDSIWLASKKDRRLQKKQGRQVEIGDSLLVQINRYWLLSNDSLVGDTVRALAREKLKFLVLERANQHPGFQQLKDRYQLVDDSVSWGALTNQVQGLDSLSYLFSSNPEQLFQLSEKLAEQKLLESSEIGEVTGALNNVDALRSIFSYREQLNQITNIDSLTVTAKDMAMTATTDYFAQHADKLKAAQGMVSKLAGKYREYSNSDNLEDAIKRTSLSGSTFWEHLVIGGNFNMVSLKPAVIDLSPQIGYKIDSRFVLGVGVTGRVNFTGDSIAHAWYVAPEHVSYKLFSNFDLFKSFYGSAEWEYSSVQRSSKSGISESAHTSVNNYFVGIGRKFLIHPKLVMTILMRYNLNGQEENPSYSKRFQVKVGIQTSDLAFRKRRINYDPNR